MLTAGRGTGCTCIAGVFWLRRLFGSGAALPLLGGMERVTEWVELTPTESLERFLQLGWVMDLKVRKLAAGGDVYRMFEL